MKKIVKLSVVLIVLGMQIAPAKAERNSIEVIDARIDQAEKLGFEAQKNAFGALPKEKMAHQVSCGLSVASLACIGAHRLSGSQSSQSVKYVGLALGVGALLAKGLEMLMFDYHLNQLDEAARQFTIAAESCQSKVEIRRSEVSDAKQKLLATYEESYGLLAKAISGIRSSSSAK